MRPRRTPAHRPADRDAFRLLAERGGIGKSSSARTPPAGTSQEHTIRMAISTARNALAGIVGTLDPSMVVNKEML